MLYNLSLSELLSVLSQGDITGVLFVIDWWQSLSCFSLILWTRVHYCMHGSINRVFHAWPRRVPVGHLLPRSLICPLEAHISPTDCRQKLYSCMVRYLVEQDRTGRTHNLGNWKFGRPRSAHVYDCSDLNPRQTATLLIPILPLQASSVNVYPKNSQRGGLGSSTTISAYGLVSELCFTHDTTTCSAYPGSILRLRHPRSEHQQPDGDDNRTFMLAKEISRSDSERLKALNMPRNMVIHLPHTGDCTGSRQRFMIRTS